MPRPGFFPEFLRHVAVNPVKQIAHICVGLYNAGAVSFNDIFERGIAVWSEQEIAAAF
jgi:hypothetical protein